MTNTTSTIWRDRQVTGFTLIELLVSVAILALLLLSFGMVLSGVRRLVYGSQQIMRDSAAAAAMSTAFREDIRRVSRNGFLCINTVDTLNPDISKRFTPQLFLTVGGPTGTLNGLSYSSANGMIVSFGVCSNQATSPTSQLLWRAGWLLNYDIAGNPVATADSFAQNQDLADFSAYPRTTIDWIIDNRLNNPIYNLVPTQVSSPPLDMAAIAQLWKCMTANCSNVSIMWAKRDSPSDSSNGMTIWWGKDNPRDPNWRQRSVKTATVDFPEYNARVDNNYNPMDSANAPALYRVMFTHENTANWPYQIKIRFTLTAPQATNDILNGSIDYEIVCSITP